MYIKASIFVNLVKCPETKILECYSIPANLKRAINQRWTCARIASSGQTRYCRRFLLRKLGSSQAIWATNIVFQFYYMHLHEQCHLTLHVPQCLNVYIFFVSLLVFLLVPLHFYQDKILKIQFYLFIFYKLELGY